VRQVCDRHGVLLIADEVVTGFGRTGELFGCRGWKVRPDIMVFAKGINSGYVPLGATMINGRIEKAFRGHEKPASCTAPPTWRTRSPAPPRSSISISSSARTSLQRPRGRRLFHGR
jgi:adenosylmethionine-8-amino-7-oxononanoate aminotransferase